MNPILALLAGAALAAGAPESLDLKKGESRTLPLTGVTRLALEDPGLAEVALDEQKQVVVRAKERDGSTTLRAWTKDGKRHELTVRVGTGEGTAPARGQAAPADRAERTLTLKAGGTLPLEVVGVKRMAIADPKVVEVRAEKSGRLTLKGLEAGSTSMQVWSAEGRTTYRVEVR